MTTTKPRTGHREPAVNRLALAMLRTTTGRLLLPGLTALRFAGRRSGDPIVLPVSYAIAGTDVMVLVGRSGEKRWWRNFRGGHAVEVLLDGRWRAGVGEVVTAGQLEYPRLLAGYRTEHHQVPAGTNEPIIHIRLGAGTVTDPAGEAHDE
jgi:hypothetical protein